VAAGFLRAGEVSVNDVGYEVIRGQISLGY
jgi:hypothetical protein